MEKTKISATYKAIIYYKGADYADTKLIENVAFACQEDFGVSVESFSGNAACDPYITIAGDHRSDVRELVEVMEDYIENEIGATVY